MAGVYQGVEGVKGLFEHLAARPRIFKISKPAILSRLEIEWWRWCGTRAAIGSRDATSPPTQPMVWTLRNGKITASHDIYGHGEPGGLRRRGRLGSSLVLHVSGNLNTQDGRSPLQLAAEEVRHPQQEDLLLPILFVNDRILLIKVAERLRQLERVLRDVRRLARGPRAFSTAESAFDAASSICQKSSD